ncbi:MAG: transposase [Waddliaceae bacterium]
MKHNQNLSVELEKGKQVALFALKTKSRSSKDVKHIGLKSAIANQILKKYSSNKKLKKISSVKLTVPSQSIKFESGKVKIRCLKMEIDFNNDIEKINQIELDKEFAYISCTVKEEEKIQAESWIGVDLNTTGHCCVASNPKSGKVLKLGKSANHTHKKYKNIRRKLQKKKRFKSVKALKNKESRVVRDLNHKISNKIVTEAKEKKSGIVLEDLKDIRKTAKTNRKNRYALNSWSFYQLKTFIEYKAKLHGVPVVKIDPRYTSQQCSRCGLLGERQGKIFKCSCGHVANADVNASFVISYRHQGILQSPVDRDIGEGHLACPMRIVA